jgi:tetratricopeptide repeat protein 25
LYQKAEALYAMGEFELALMFYHRGKKLRPDLREFQLGINKAQEAIDNSVGGTEDYYSSRVFQRRRCAILV